MEVVKKNITVLLLGIKYITYNSIPVAPMDLPPPTVNLNLVALLIPPSPIHNPYPEAVLEKPPEMVLESDR